MPRNYTLTPRYLGYGVSAGLCFDDPFQPSLNVELPALSSLGDLSEHTGIPVGKLIWLCYHNEISTVDHYVRICIPKPMGGIRALAIPKYTMRHAQQWIKEEILDHFEPHSCAHAYRKGRSIISAASPHVDSRLIARLDLRDFFGSVVFKAVKTSFPGVATMRGCLRFWRLSVPISRRRKEL